MDIREAKGFAATLDNGARRLELRADLFGDGGGRTDKALELLCRLGAIGFLLLAFTISLPGGVIDWRGK